MAGPNGLDLIGWIKAKVDEFDLIGWIGFKVNGLSLMK